MMPQLEASSGGDFELYCTLVQGGTFYEFLITALQQRGVSVPREVLKRKFLADVIAKKKANSSGAEYPSAVKDVFADLFPTVHAYIRRVNRDGWEHGNLIRELQRQESQLVIETVAADLVSRHPGVFFITLHDAIYSTARHLSKIQEGFQRAFEQIDFPMAIKVA